MGVPVPEPRLMSVMECLSSAWTANPVLVWAAKLWSVRHIIPATLSKCDDRYSLMICESNPIYLLFSRPALGLPLIWLCCFDHAVLLLIPVLFSFYQSLECGRGAMDDNASVLLPRSFLSISFFTILICFLPSPSLCIHIVIWYAVTLRHFYSLQ